MKNFLSRISSRKFLVWLVATGALFIGKIEGNLWAVISCIYIGGNVLKYLVEILKTSFSKKEL